MQVTPHGGLANRCTRPLCDLSTPPARNLAPPPRVRGTSDGRLTFPGASATVRPPTWTRSTFIRARHERSRFVRPGFAGRAGRSRGPTSALFVSPENVRGKGSDVRRDGGQRDPGGDPRREEPHPRRGDDAVRPPGRRGGRSRRAG